MTRPRSLVDRSPRQSDDRKIEIDDFAVETFTLSVEAARRKVRDILDRVERRGYLAIVEHWRQLPDGKIEFTMRRVPTSE